MAVEDLFLSAFLQVLFDRLASRKFIDLLRYRKFDDLLEKLKITLLTVTALPNDAEEKQFHSPAVAKWLHMARDALYATEDILDELATETLRCKLEGESNLILLRLNNCRNYSSLPPLGKLPSLKNLTVKGMDRIQRIGIEFCGDGCSSAMHFPSLETLKFDSMLQWEEWSSSGVEGRDIEIHNYPKLTRLPHHFPGLKKFHLHAFV